MSLLNTAYKPRITAESLQKRDPQKREIIDRSTEIYRRCEDAIEQAYNERQTCCRVGIPMLFRVEGMDNRSATLLIHTQAINALEAADFHVVIYPGDDECMWKISGWAIRTDTELNTKLTKVLASRVNSDYRNSQAYKGKRRDRSKRKKNNITDGET